MEIISHFSIVCSDCGGNRIFSRQSSYKEALKLGVTRCHKCSIKHRRLSKSEQLHTWEYTCPVCGEIKHYKNRNALARAIRQKSFCRKCFLLKYKKYETEADRVRDWYERHKKRVIESSKIRYQKEREKRKNGDIETIMKFRLQKLRNRAKLKGVSCSVTKEELLQCYKNQQGKCYYSGMPMVLTLEGAGTIEENPYQITVDRLDSQKGYDKDNIVLCCLVANSAKSVLSQEEFFTFIENVYHRIKTSLRSKEITDSHIL